MFLVNGHSCLCISIDNFLFGNIITIVIVVRIYDCLGGGARRVRRAKIIFFLSRLQRAEDTKNRENRVRPETRACRNV